MMEEIKTYNIGESRGCPPPPSTLWAKISSFSCSLWKKWSNSRLFVPLRVGALPLPGKSWINHCITLHFYCSEILLWACGFVERQYILYLFVCDRDRHICSRKWEAVHPSSGSICRMVTNTRQCICTIQVPIFGRDWIQIPPMETRITTTHHFTLLRGMLWNHYSGNWKHWNLFMQSSMNGKYLINILLIENFIRWLNRNCFCFRIFLYELGGNPNKKNSRNETSLHCVCTAQNAQTFTQQQRR